MRAIIAARLLASVAARRHAPKGLVERDGRTELLFEYSVIVDKIHIDDFGPAKPENDPPVGGYPD